MAVTLDAATVGKWAFTTSHTISTHTVAAGASLLTVEIAHRTYTVSSVTWNGSALTQLRKKSEAPSDAEIWYILSPDSGNHDLVIQHGAEGRTVFSIRSWLGGDPSDPFRDQGGVDYVEASNGFSGTASVTATTNASDLVIDCCAYEGSVDTLMTVGANQTADQNDCQTGPPRMHGGMSRQLGSDGGIMSWTLPASGAWAIIAASLVPASAAAAAGTSVPMKMLMGVGL